MQNVQSEDVFSLLSSANNAFQEGDYVNAIQIYNDLTQTTPQLAEIFLKNIRLIAHRQLIESKFDKAPLVHLKLSPLNQITQFDSVGAEWLALGNDPFFYASPEENTQLTPGWYCVYVAIQTNEPYNLAKFYINYGDGYSESNAFSVPYKKGTLTHRIIYINNTIQSIRFDPKESKGIFSVFEICLEKISDSLAVSEMIKHTIGKDGNTFDTELAYLSHLESKAALSNITPTNFLWLDYDKGFGSILDSNYESWQELIETPSQPLQSVIRKKSNAIGKAIKFSIVLPTYNTPEKYLRECIDSVKTQSYQNWELCIADDASTLPHVKKILDEYQKNDSRIKVFYREKNGHISLASNSALELATGTHIVLLDHDDLLANNALFYFADLLHKNPKIEIAYSDEDKISEAGQRYDPHFKSDWNPELFYSHNYVSHLGVYKRSLIDKIKGFRQGVEGSQDYDLLLRCLPHVSSENIAHIPRILYHWRSIEGSTASAAEGKSYTTDAGQKALTDYFKTINKAIKVVSGPVPNTYRVKWPLPKSKPLVSLIIPTRDRVELVEVAVRSILKKTTYTNYEILIIDNGSTDLKTLEFFKKIQVETKKVKVFAFDKPFNYSEINNFGVTKSKGSIIGLINNDVEVISPEWLDEMVRQAIRPDVGCVGAKLYYSNDTVQHAGVICSLGGVAGHSHKSFPRNHPGYFHRLVLTQALSAVTAACLLIKRNIFLEVGGLDEVNLKVAFNDVDFCLKVGAAGYRNVWTPYAELYHYESISRGAEDSPEKVERFNGEITFMKNKWPAVLSQDPYYNLNLTKDLEDFSISSASYYQLEGL